jgi:hypothetical protein
MPAARAPVSVLKRECLKIIQSVLQCDDAGVFLVHVEQVCIQHRSHVVGNAFEYDHTQRMSRSASVTAARTQPLTLVPHTRRVSIASNIEEHFEIGAEKCTWSPFADYAVAWLRSKLVYDRSPFCCLRFEPFLRRGSVACRATDRPTNHPLPTSPCV